MTITGIQLRCGSDKTKSITIPAPVGGVVAGSMYIVGTYTVGVAYETKAEGLDVALCISAHKILLPKVGGSLGNAIAQGERIYFTAGAAGVDSAGGTLCGRCLVAAAAMDDTILADFNGDVAA
jgi:predicted RecA/RadA family phage recombinase